jgi:hypothetical protein
MWWTKDELEVEVVLGFCRAVKVSFASVTTLCNAMHQTCFTPERQRDPAMDEDCHPLVVYHFLVTTVSFTVDQKPRKHPDMIGITRAGQRPARNTTLQSEILNSVLL